MTEGDVAAALISRHRLDLFYTGVGVHINGSDRVLDAVAITTARPHMVTVYEIKCSHNDFTSDAKWPEYLNVCNRLFFACPDNLIKPEELPPGTGLVYCHGNTSRTVKRTPYMARPLDATLLMSLLRNHTSPDPDVERRKRILTYQTALSNKNEGKDLSWLLHIETRKRLLDAKNSVRDLRYEVEELKHQLLISANPVPISDAREIKMARLEIKNAKHILDRAEARLG